MQAGFSSKILRSIIFNDSALFSCWSRSKIVQPCSAQNSSLKKEKIRLVPCCCLDATFSCSRVRDISEREIDSHIRRWVINSWDGGAAGLKRHKKRWFCQITCLYSPIKWNVNPFVLVFRTAQPLARFVLRAQGGTKLSSMNIRHCPKCTQIYSWQ